MARVGLLILAALAACATSGRLPKTVVELYDVGKPDGWMEIEAERDGTIIEVEVDIAVADLPGNVRAAARKELPGGAITGAEIEIVGGKRSYEVKMRQAGRNYEFVFTPGGVLIESEKELLRNEAPEGVVDAAMRAVPGGSFKSVEVIEKAGEKSYHVKLIRGGASYKIVVSPAAGVIRKVREAKCEIEIPLR